MNRADDYRHYTVVTRDVDNGRVVTKWIYSTSSKRAQKVACVQLWATTVNLENKFVPLERFEVVAVFIGWMDDIKNSRHE